MCDSSAAEKLKFPYLSAYLDSVGTTFRHGADFATGGSSIRPGGYSPFHLGLQVSQFIQFKSRTTYLYNQLNSNSQFLIHCSFQIPHYRASSLCCMDVSHIMSNNDYNVGYLMTDRTSRPIKSNIARPQEFSKALYTFDIAQNDLSYGFQHSSEEQVKASIPDILNTFSQAMQVSNLNHSLNNEHKNISKEKLKMKGLMFFLVYVSATI